MQMTPTSGASSPMDNTLIPTGALLWAMVNFRGMKIGQEKGSRYADVELTVADQQPFSRRKIWTKVADPDFAGNSDKYKEMGMVSLTRMVEACNIVNPQDAASYEKLNGLKIEQVMAMLDGKYVAIKVKIEPGKTGYQDKNDVAAFLTPNPQSDGNKGFLKLMAGDYGVPTNPAAQRGAFGNTLARLHRQRPRPTMAASAIARPRVRVIALSTRARRRNPLLTNRQAADLIPTALQGFSQVGRAN